MLYWLCLAGAIALEIAGTVSMKLSRGFTVLLPSILLFVFYACSFAMMTIAVRRIDMSVSYAIWSAVGTASIADRRRLVPGIVERRAGREHRRHHRGRGRPARGCHMRAA